METFKEKFTDFDLYKETVKNWDINYKLLSKNDFSAYLHMVYDDNFSVTREKLTGKVETEGKTLKGFVVFGIPVNKTTLCWFGKNIGCDTLIIAPRENNFEIIANADSEIYTVSINENYFFDVLKKLGLGKNGKIINGQAQEFFLTKDFSNRFINLLDYYLNANLKNENKNKALIYSITYSLVEYLKNTDPQKIEIQQTKKDIAVKKAVELINNNVNQLYSITQLCAMVGVSERTLLSAFKEKYKVSPSNYIKAFRLNLVKQEIFNNTELNISEIAGRHHFWHMGQFAKDFKKQFGILPSEAITKPLVK